jgi:cyclase
MKKLSVICSLLLLFMAFSFAEEGIEKELFHISKLIGSLYRIEYAPSYNLVQLASIGDEGILLIDTGMESTAQALLRELKKMGSGKIAYIINTHVHRDHVGGNPLFAPEAPIIAHINVKKRYSPPHLLSIKKKGEPNITFTDTMNLFFNGETVIIKHIPSGHTDGDSIVYFPDSNILYMGDLVISGRFSTVDLSLGGDVDGFINSLKSLISDYPDATRFFPAHGPEYSKQDLIKYHQAFAVTLLPIERELKRGKTVEQIVNSEVFKDYRDWLRKDDWVKVIQARLSMKDH